MKGFLKMSENVKKINKDEEKKKFNISEKNLAIIITAAVLVIALLSVSIFFIVDAISKDVGFSYEKSDLDKYIEFSKDYKDFELELDIAKPHDIDVDVAILNLIYKDREIGKYGNNAVVSPITITAGDNVNLWYRGYILDEEGNQISVEGMSNFGNASPHTLGIGSNGFVPGFELNLIGINTGDMNKFAKITTGALQEDYIIYVTYTEKESKDSKDGVTKSNVRIDLTEDIDAIYGEGFKEAVLKKTIGAKADLLLPTNDPAKAKVYYDFSVNFATTCEREPVTIECYFPYDYQKETLRNETAYFEVYVDSVVVYDCPEFTDEYLKTLIEDKEINITLDELNEYEGDSLVAKYRDFAEKKMLELYEEEYKTMLETAIWEYYQEITKGIKFPAGLVEELFDDYVDDISEQFITSGGQAYDQTTGQYKTYDTLEKYIPAYLGLSANANWRVHVTALAQQLIKERMTLFYILRAENLMPTEERHAEETKALRQEYLDEYIEQYLEYHGKTREDYNDTEWDELVANCTEELFSYYEADYFEMRAYYTILNETIIDWPEVITLDERRAYPLDK